MTSVEYQRWLETDRCKRSGCAAVAIAGSAFCSPHHEDNLRYDRERKARQRAAHPKRCKGCHGAEDRLPGSKYGPKCLARLQRGFARGRLSSGSESGSAAKLRLKDSDGRLRYHGQGKRGRRPRSDDEFYALKEARREMEAYERGLTFERSPEFAAWSQQQRKTFHVENLGHKARAMRWLRGADIAEDAQADEDGDA